MKEKFTIYVIINGKRDYSCSFDDRCKRFCKNCGLWANPYMYQ